MLRRLFKFTPLLMITLIAVTAVFRQHFDEVEQARTREYELDRSLDKEFERRPPQPLEVHLLLATDEGGMIGAADRPSFQRRIAKLKKLPVVLDLPGCGFPTWAKGVPNNVAMLVVSEEPKLLHRKSLIVACRDRDGPAIKASIEAQRDALVSYVQRASWVDRSRMLMTGSGEATPIVASFSGPLKGRVMLGDPCVVRWSSISTSSPLLMLATTYPQGIYSGRTPNVDRTKAALAGLPVLPPTLTCTGLPRPVRSPAKVIVAPGTILATDRPEPLMQALADTYARL
jgi:hypothetical protein